MNGNTKRPQSDFGCTTSIEVIKQFVPLKGTSVVDVGCGDMTFSMPLAELGAQVLAIDPDPVQAKLNRESEPRLGLTFAEAGAESLPVADRSMDGVFFSYSLHHIPAETYPRVFQEIFRVLKPGGFLLVIEPLGCPLNEVMKLFHDEDRERAAAQQGLVELAVPRFDLAEVVTYHSFIQYDSFDQFADRYSSRSFNTLYTEADVRHPAVEAAFEAHGQPDYRFQSPKQAMILRGFQTKG